MAATDGLTALDLARCHRTERSAEQPPATPDDQSELLQMNAVLRGRRSTPSLEVIENLTRPLGVDLKDLFDFGHLDPDATAPEGFVKDISNLDEHD